METLDHWRGIPDLYDILVNSPLNHIPPGVATEDRPLVEEAVRQHNNPNGPNGLDMYSGKIVYLARPLEEARHFLRAFHDVHQHALLMPVRYRTARFGRVTARGIAQGLLTQWRATHDGNYGSLSAGTDRRLYWLFHAAELEHNVEGSGAWFSVDRWDGHEVTSGELWNWARFSRGSRTTAEHWKGIPDQYDLHLTAWPMRNEPDIPEEDRRLVEEALQSAQKRGERGTMVTLARSISEVRTLLNALRPVGVYGGAVPVRYHQPRVDREAARRSAQRYLTDLPAAEEQPLGKLDAGTDWVLWWQFRTERASKQASQRTVFVDKWEGQVTTDDWELKDWHEFSTSG